MAKSNKNPRKIYLDYASGSIVASANPSSIHSLGVNEKNKLENARGVVAGILHVNRNEIIFTSGSTESNNLAIMGLLNSLQDLKYLPHIVTTNIEHSSVLEVFKYLESTGKAEVTFVEVESTGIVDPKKIKKVLKKNTVLVSVMYANNEIGTIEPISDIAKEIRHFNKNNNTKIYLHTDATQAVNYLSMNVSKLGVDLLSFNGAKIYGPKGAGVLFVKNGTPLMPIMFGGEQERGLRPGTENVSSIVALSKALIETEKIKEKENKRLIKLRDYFIKKLNKLGFILNGDAVQRLPNNINVTILNIPSDLLVIELSTKGIMASAKSACKAGDGKSSYVIEAINKEIKDTDGSLRFSLGRSTNKKDIDDTIKVLNDVLKKLKKWYY